MAELPEPGDIVICKITKILDYGVFADLSEYEGTQGFVHISQVSSSWIKNIRNFVKEGQVRVAKVVNLDPNKKQIDLSFNKVSAGMQRAKIEEWKQSKRSQKLIELVAEQKKESFEIAWKEVAEPLLQKYDSLYEAFQNILSAGEEAATGVPKKWLKPLVEIISKNVELPEKTVKGVLTLSSNAPDGVLLIKDALVNAKNSSKDAEVDIYYTGSGKYVVKVNSFEYKVAERVLKEVADNAVNKIKEVGGEGEFERAS